MEEHFKNKLKNHKVDWDKEELLGNLKQELSQDKRRFNWKWFLLLPLLLIATCWGWNGLEMPTDNSTLTLIENNSAGIEKENTPVNNTPENQTNINLEKNTASSKSVKKSSKKATEFIQSAIEVKEGLNTKDSKTNPKSNLKSNISSLSNLSNSNAPSSVEQPPIQDLNIIEVEKSELANNFIEIPIAKKTGDIINPNGDETRKDSVEFALISYLDLKELDLIGEEANLPALNITAAIQKEKKDDKDSLKNTFYISGAGEIGLHDRSRTFISDNAEYVNLLESNEETEKSLFSFTTNLHLGYQFTSAWSLQSGLEYTEIKEVFNYKKLTTETIPREKVRYIIVDNLDTLYVLDTINVFKTKERTVKHFNKHTFYSIPLSVAYRFDLKKAKLLTRLGLSYTFSHDFKGRMNIFNEAEGSEIYDENPEFGFELKNRIGIQAGLGVEYPFLKKSQIFATATYRRSHSLTFGVIEQHHHSLSFGAGLKFIF